MRKRQGSRPGKVLAWMVLPNYHVNIRIVITGDREWQCDELANAVVNRLIVRYGPDVVMAGNRRRPCNQAHSDPILERPWSKQQMLTHVGSISTHRPRTIASVQNQFVSDFEQSAVPEL